VEAIFARVPLVKAESASDRPAEVPVPVVTPEVICTEPVAAGTTVMLPEVVVCRAKAALVELMVNPPEVTLQVEAAAPVRFKAPAEVTARVPEVAVDSVRLALVVVKEEAAPEAKARAPAKELPILTAPVEVPVLMLVAKLDEALRLAAAPLEVMPVVVVRPAVVTLKVEPALMKKLAAGSLAPFKPR